MTLLEKIIAAFPELQGQYHLFTGNPILLQNDADDTGDYIAKWEYSKPIPESLQQYVR